MTKVSVIIAAWNGLADLPDCLGSVLSQRYPDFEVIVVDDASRDGSVDYVTRNFPSVRLLRNAHNSGYAVSCNRGLAAAEGDILVLLNQDTEVHPGWLRAFVETLHSDGEIGIVGGKCLYPDGSIQHAGGYLDAQGGGHHYGYGETDKGQWEQRRDVEFVTGANLAISRLALERMGRLDEAFSPAYFEDVDWCLRAKEAGFQVLYEPKAVITHKEASVLAREDRESMYRLHRNRMRLVLKHWPLSRLVEVFAAEESNWLQNLAAGGERLVSVMHNIYLYYLLNLGDIVTQREAIFEPVVDEVDILARVLLDLRSVIPLKPMKVVRSSDSGVRESGIVERANSLAGLHEGWTIEPRPFHSDVPVLGPLIAKFRQLWNRISTEWYVRPLIQQQTEFNAQLVETLACLHRDLNLAFENQQRLSEDHLRSLEVLEAYFSESGREIASLAEILGKLKREYGGPAS